MAGGINKQKAEIERICRRLGITPAQLAERAAIKPETMRKISKGYQAASERMMQSLRNVELLYASIGKATKKVDYGLVLKEQKGKIEREPRGIKQVPIVSWASAGAAHDYSDMSEQIDEVVETSSTDANSFALIIEGDSMLPRFEAGDVVIFEPNSEPRNGDIVVAKLIDGHGVLFKKFRRVGAEGKTIRLESLNPDYKTAEYAASAFQFIYPAVEFKSRIRRP